MTVEFSCPRCGKDYALPARLAGRLARCKRCELVMTVPKSGEPIDEVARPARSRGDDRARATRTRPADPLGMEEVEDLPPRIESPSPTAHRPRKPPGPRRSILDNFPRPRFTHAVLAWWLLLLGLAGLSFVVEDGAFRCSQLIVWMGIFLISTGWVWFVATAFREGLTRGLLVMFVPFYWLYHLFDSWFATSRPFWTNLAGIFSIVVGSLFYSVRGDDVGERALLSLPGSAARRRVAIVEDDLPLRPPAIDEGTTGERALVNWKRFVDALATDRRIQPLATRKKKAMIRAHGEDKVVVVLIEGVYDAATFDAVADALRPLAGTGAEDFFAYSISRAKTGASMMVTLAPVADGRLVVDALGFCSRVDLGPTGRQVVALAPRERVPDQLLAELDRDSAAIPKASRSVAPTAKRSPETPEPADRRVAPRGPDVLASAGELELPFSPGLGGSGRLLYPTTNSRFVAIGDHLTAADSRESWDLTARRRIGVISGRMKLGLRVALSPDGASMVGITADQQAVEVWSFETGGLVRKIEANTIVDAVDFVGPDRVLISTPFTHTYYLCDVATGRQVRTIASPVPVDRDSFALDVDGKSLALASSSRKAAGVYSLDTGRMTANWNVPPAQPYAAMNCRGMVFSMDGTELAGLFEDSKFTRFMAWGPGNKVVADALVANRTPDSVPKPPLYQGRPLEWLPDRSGWMVYGRAIVDKQTGKRAWTIPSAADDTRGHPRRLLDTGELLIVEGPRTAPVLRSVRLPLDEIAAAIQAVRSHD